MVKKKLSDARVMKPISRTSFMRDKVLFAALAARPELPVFPWSSSMIVDDPNQRHVAPVAVDPESCATGASRTAWL